MILHAHEEPSTSACSVLWLCALGPLPFIIENSQCKEHLACFDKSNRSIFMPVVCFYLANKTDFSSDFDVLAKFRLGLLAVKLAMKTFSVSSAGLGQSMDCE